MGRIVSSLLMLFWGLWFGGTIALFIFVSALFRQSREMAIHTTPVLFLTFERYHLLLAGVAAVLSGVWLGRERSKAKAALFVLLLLAGVAASVSGALITPRVMVLREQRQTQSPEFKRLHGMSMMVYSTEAVALLAGGLVLSVAMRQRAEDAKTAAAVPNGGGADM